MTEPFRAAVARAPDPRVARGFAAACPWLTAGIALAVYGATLAPTIGFGDSPELSAAALSLGVPHPTGYPLLMLLGYGFSTLFAVGDPAWRLNLLGALLAAAAVGFGAAFVQRLTGRAVAGFVAGLLLAFSPAFWSSATLFEVYGLHVAFVTALLLLWLRFEQDPRPPRLRVLVIVAGLSCTHHLMIALILPILAAAVMRHRRVFGSPGELARLVALFVLPLGVAAYLPLAALADPIVNWGDPSSPLRFWSHVTGRQYHGNVGGVVDIPWWRGGVDHLRATAAGSTPFVLGLAVLGGMSPFFPAPRQAAWPVARVGGFVLIALFVVGFGFGSVYEVVDRDPFFLNATVATSLLAGIGGARCLDWIEQRHASTARLAWVGLALLPVLPLWIGWNQQDRSHDYAAHDHAVALMQTLPRDAVLLVQGYEGYPAVYASLIEGLRADVLVVDHYLRIRGEGGGYGPELERIRHLRGLPADRIVSTVTATAAGLGRPLFIVPEAPDIDWGEIGLIRVRRGLVDQLIARGSGRLPIGPSPVEALARFEDGPLLLAARLGRSTLEPGDATPVQLEWAWPGDAADEGRAAWQVWIVSGDADGELLAGIDGRPLVDHAHPLGQGIAVDGGVGGDAWLESIALVMPRSLPVGPVSLFAALMRDGSLVPTRDERAFVRLGTIELTPRIRAAWQLSAPDTPPAASEAQTRRLAEAPARP